MRLFAAIDLPAPVKEQLETLETRIPTARWIQRQQMHQYLRHLVTMKVGPTTQPHRPQPP